MSGTAAAPTVLEKWKQLAEVENKRARANWGSTGGWYQRPEQFEDPEITAARQRRDDRIVALAAQGLSSREIGARVGLVETSVNRILRVRRLAAARDKRRQVRS